MFADYKFDLISTEIPMPCSSLRNNNIGIMEKKYKNPPLFCTALVPSISKHKNNIKSCAESK